MRIAVLALDGLFDTGLTVMPDALGAANKLAVRAMGRAPDFEVSIVGMRKRVQSSHGLLIPVQPVAATPRPDWVIVPALNTTSPDELLASLERADLREAKAQLIRWHEAGAKIGASCIGTFLLAETGLPDGRQVTTNWPLAPLFRQRYPDIRVDESRMPIPSDIGVTAG
ncbi:hypothetical protein [Burkholderia plantarii]|uniref:hypothetical protein n=1 Tax=Burkholderia plantarii TaxID=41899 RepID=UPI0008707B11|nr:hypothetical protein [Burkholderia plantarii]